MKEIGPDWHPIANPDILIESIDDEMVAYVPDTDQVHLLNMTAAAVYELCDGTASVHDIITTIKDSAQTSSKAVAEDIKKIISDFNEKSLLK